MKFILAVPRRRYNEFAEQLEPISLAVSDTNLPKIVAEQAWRRLRLVVAHDQHRAAEQTAQRNQKAAALEAQAAAGSTIGDWLWSRHL